MKRLLAVGAIAALMMVLPVVPAGADSIVTFVGRVVNVPVSLPDAAGPPTVELLVEPTWEVQQAAEAAGEIVSVLSVAEAPATPSFSLSLDLDALGPEFVNDEGYVNVMVAAKHGGRVSTWGVPVWPGDSIKEIPAFDMARAPVPPAGPLSDAEVSARSATELAAAAPPCGSIVWYNFNGPYQTKVMDIMNPSVIPGRGSYFHGGSTSTTLGYLKKGTTNWQVGGTMTTGSSASTGFDVPAVSQRIQALWMYRERAVVCVGNQNVPVNYYGKGNQPSITHVKYTNCGSAYPPGGNYVHSSTRNQTYSVGVTVYGIGLSSQAGYTSTATIRFHFNEKGRVCGNSSTLGEASPKVDAHKTA
jgi:hypothetical protein